MSVIDERRPPFCYQYHVDIERVRARFHGRQLATALATYVALTYYASVHFREGGRGGFVAGRKELARVVGIKPETFDVIAKGFIEIGLVEKRRRFDQYGAEVAPVWVLTEGSPLGSVPGDETGSGSPLEGDPPSPLGEPETGTPTRAGQTKVDVDVVVVGAEDAGARDPRVPIVVGSDPVTPDEASLALDALTAFNEAAGTRYASKDFVAAIIRRHREHPEVTLEQHRELVAANFRDPWWKDAPTPSVIWGNANVFERSVFRDSRPNGASGRRTARDYRDAFKSVRSDLDH